MLAQMSDILYELVEVERKDIFIGMFLIIRKVWALFYIWVIFCNIMSNYRYNIVSLERKEAILCI